MLENSNRGAVVVVTGNVSPEQINAAAQAAASAQGPAYMAEAGIANMAMTSTLIPAMPARRGRKPGRKPGSGRGPGRPPKAATAAEPAATPVKSMTKQAINARKRRREATKAREAK